MYYKLDKNKNPVRISLEEAAQVINQDRQVLTNIVGGHYISTVFLCIDHGFGDEPPVLFETMVFEGTSVGVDIDCNRYSSYEEAIQGHIDMVKKYLPEGVLYCFDKIEKE